MNFERSKWRRDAAARAPLDEAELARRKRRRRAIILGVAIALVAIVAAAIFFGREGAEPGASAAPTAEEGAQSAPAVTVIVPGREEVSRTISATGTLAARRDLPVGVSGEGGSVARVLVDEGDWVRAGQTLAVIERSVQSQQARQLAAQIEVARADARLAQNELDRALALEDRGFVSKADIDRKRAARDAARARVDVAEAQLAETRARIRKLNVTAPAGGLVLDRMVEVGQVVGPGSGPLLSIARRGEMEKLAELPAEDQAELAGGVR
ncbi:MAG: efflux RND transporter periplasmic adaptor subunit, partial [Sphingomonadaceae bacterium]